MPGEFGVSGFDESPQGFNLAFAGLAELVQSSPGGPDLPEVIADRFQLLRRLGGGSSDAATTLLALNRLWGLNWPRERLLQLALPLGADVPFFVGGRSAFVEGIGEQLTPLPAGSLAGQSFMVVKPPQPIDQSVGDCVMPQNANDAAHSCRRLLLCLFRRPA